MSSLTFEDWKRTWKNNITPWHEEEVNKHLIENIVSLTNGEPNRRILIPLCGKTLDMICTIGTIPKRVLTYSMLLECGKWLVNQGHQVIGVEFVRKAIEEFFSGNDIPFDREEINLASQPAYVYSAFDGKLKIFECDYYSFNSNVAGGKVDCIWDCHALGTVPPCKRKQYLKTSLELLRDSPSSRILHLAMVHEPKRTKGPPFTVTLEDLTALLGDKFELEALGEEVLSDIVCAELNVTFAIFLVVCMKYKG